MRRCVSAPANLCLMAHRKLTPESKCEEEKNGTSVSIVSRTGGDLVDEAVRGLEQELMVVDPTQQFVMSLVVRKLIMENDDDFVGMAMETAVRAVVSFFIHSFVSHFVSVAYCALAHTVSTLHQVQ